MSEPLSSRPPSDREAWVEAQVWRRCVEARRELDGVARGETAPLDREALQGLVAKSWAQAVGADSPSEPTGEDERLLGVAQSAMLLSMLPSRPAPAELDTVLEELDELDSELEEADPTWGPDLLATFQRDEASLRELMTNLRPQVAPAALDAHFEAELARHQGRRSEIGAAAGALDAPATGTPLALPRGASALPRGTSGPIRSTTASTGPRLVWRRRLAWAAAAALVGAIGVAIFWRDGALGGGLRGEEGPRNSSRFSFRYVDVETAGADIANRPALRLLRGWASHISPDALESPSAPK
jgi:hypothetical protein